MNFKPQSCEFVKEVRARYFFLHTSIVTTVVYAIAAVDYYNVFRSILMQS